MYNDGIKMEIKFCIHYKVIKSHTVAYPTLHFHEQSLL